MGIVRNIFVEKKSEFQQEAKKLDQELKDMLGLTLSSRMVHLYQVEGLSEEEMAQLTPLVFSDPSLDVVHEKPFSFLAQPHFILELLPGQFDQRAEAVKECAELILNRRNIAVRYKTVYVFDGVDTKTLDKLCTYLLNPVEKRRGEMESSFEPSVEWTQEETVLQGFVEASQSALENFLKEHRLAMSLSDLIMIQGYFKEEGREPNLTEVKVLDTYWSDHCRHTTFMTTLEEVDLEEADPSVQKAYGLYEALRHELGWENKPRTLMDLATIGAKVLKKRSVITDLDESDEINACSIQRTLRTQEGPKEALIMFKNETHNHPTEIEPFGGAATCLGGAIRDPLSGRTYVYQGMRITGAGNPNASLADTRPGKLPQKTITQMATKGFSSYGNQIGLTTGFVEEIYHPGYEAKRMETGAVIGANLKDHVHRGKPMEGDLIVLIGGRTGRDGIGGATGSSKEQTSSSVRLSGSEVQKGNAVEERKLQRFFRQERATALIKKANDFGAGGVSVAIGELADSLDIHLDQVPKKYQGLSPMDIALSESQERMAVVLSPNSLGDFLSLAKEENLEATVVATVTSTGALRMYYGERLVVDLKRAFLNLNGATARASVKVAPGKQKEHASPVTTLQEGLQAMDNLAYASQKGLLENFDTTIGSGTLLLPYGGKNQETKSPGMAALIPLKDLTTYDASLMAYGFDPEKMERDPFVGAHDAVVESLAKILAMGGDLQGIRLSFQEYFRKLGEDPFQWGKPFSALLGALQAQMDFQVPAIGGKDSMSGSFEDLHVPNTLISFAVNTEHMEKLLTNDLKGGVTTIMKLTTPRIDNLYDQEAFKRNAAFLMAQRDKGHLLSVDTLKKGILPTLVNMALGNDVGVHLLLHGENLLGYDPGSFLLEVPTEKVPELLLEGAELSLRVLGKTRERAFFSTEQEEIALAQFLRKVKAPLQSVFPSFEAQGAVLEDFTSTITPKAPKRLVDKPKVLIPVFVGTNCEMDLERVFRKEGAEVTTFVLTSVEETLQESIKDFCARLRESDLLMLAGGFSAQDEPEGSGKYIANFLRNPQVKEAVEDLLRRDGLILGICNGFQGLIKSGLLPYGEILSPKDTMPVLTYNTSAKHMSRMVQTKVISRNTPWMSKASLGDVHHVPISHGEGRLVVSEFLFQELKKKGQVITQYVNEKGQPTMEAPYNPNGSYYAIEGLASPCGKIFGKMGHSERCAEGLYQNYAGQYYLDFFKAGLAYFKDQNRRDS